MKQHIMQHFDRKFPCPCSDPVNGITLTDEIKEYVYKNRKYKPSKHVLGGINRTYFSMDLCMEKHFVITTNRYKFAMTIKQLTVDNDVVIIAKGDVKDALKIL